MSQWNKWFSPSRQRPVWSRRAFLGGAAAVVGLPFLRSLSPRNAYAAGEFPVRLAWMYAPNGINMTDFTPDNVGENYDLKRIIASLADYQDQVSVISGLSNMVARTDRPGDHARGTGSFLTCEEVLYEGISNGVSADQVAAQAFGGETLLSSLELGAEGGTGFGECDSGYSCAYSQNISWASATTPQPKVDNPKVAFERLFVGVDTSLSETEREKRAVYQTSVLDLVLDDVNRLSPRLGTSDQAKLDEYLTGLRELEERIVAGESNTCEPGAAPASYVDDEDLPRTMVDIMVIAFKCDMTRVCSFMFGNGATNKSHRWLGVSGGHHQISHHQNDAQNLEYLSLIDEWEVAQYAYFVEQLAKTEEGDGTLLDNTLLMFGSGIADGNSHSHSQLPILLAGGGAGAHAPGRHIEVAGNRALGDLYVTMLQAAGVDIDSFGRDGIGPLSEIAG